MKLGTKFKIELIECSTDVKNMSLKTSLSARNSSLKTAIYNEGIEIYETLTPKEIHFQDNIKQLRQNIVLILSKPKTKNDIYKVINKVRSQPIKFLK